MLGGMAATVDARVYPSGHPESKQNPVNPVADSRRIDRAVVLISTSYGAWLAVLCAVGVWAVSRGVGWWAGRSRVSIQDTRRARLAALVLLALLGLAVLAAVVLVVPPGQLPGTIRLSDRIRLARESLANWHAITCGPVQAWECFPLQFSIYTLLIHVPYATHSHNVLVDLVIEQGLLGLVSLRFVARHRGRYGPAASNQRNR